jgi:hypothetical protein
MAAAEPGTLEPEDVEVDEDAVVAEERAHFRAELKRLVAKHDVEADIDSLFVEDQEEVDVRAELRRIAEECVPKYRRKRNAKSPAGRRDAIKAHAIRQTGPHKDLVEDLTKNQGTASDYRMATALIESHWFVRGDFEFRRRWHMFTEHNSIHAWAYGMPFAEAKVSEAFFSATSEEGVRQSIFGCLKWKKSTDGLDGRELVGRRDGLLDRNSSDLLLVANAAALSELREADPEFMADFGRTVALDSLRIRASALQSRSVSEAHEDLINRYLGCDMGSHDDVYWRGWMMLTLLDLSTGLPIAWVMFKASEKEAPRLREILTKAYELLPWLEIKVLTADKAFDTEEAYRITEREFGIHLMADLRRQLSDDPSRHPHAATLGCPVHEKGCGQVMTLHQSTFHDVKRRKALGLNVEKLVKGDGEKEPGGLWFEREDDVLIVHDEERGDEHKIAIKDSYNSRNNPSVVATLRPGQDVSPLIEMGLVEREVLRWTCDCDSSTKVQDRTYPDEDWRLHTWAPRLDVHGHGRTDRFRFREEMRATHSSGIEGYHGELRLRGIGLDGADAPRSPNTAQAVRWLHFGRAYLITASTLVVHNGGYERSRREAEEQGLLRAPDQQDLDCARERYEQDTADTQAALAASNTESAGAPEDGADVAPEGADVD